MSDREKDPIDVVVKEFGFSQRESLQFTILVAAFTLNISASEKDKDVILEQTEAIIPPRILDAAIHRLDELTALPQS